MRLRLTPLSVLPSLFLVLHSLSCVLPPDSVTSADGTASTDGATPDPPGAAAAKSISVQWLQQSLGAMAADDTEGRDNLTAGGKKARQYLISRLKGLGLKPGAKQGWEQPFDKGVNVVAVLPGADAKLASEYLILSAHYDHLGLVGVKGSQCKDKKTKIKAQNAKVCNGAVDNAAGCSVVLAMVRALQSSKTQLKRSLLVVFWDAEEDGLLGSKYFADSEPLVPLNQVVAMFSVDALGGEIVTGLVPFFALGLEYSSGMRKGVHDVAATTGNEIHAVSSFFTGSEVGGRSDHLPFRLKSVPVIFFSSGAPPQYHSPADEISSVNFTRLTEMARQILLVTARVADAAQRPTFVKEPRPHLDDARALVALGDYVVKNPASAGITESMANMLKPMLKQLKDYIKTPPSTEAQWQEYQTYVKSVVNLVFSFAGR